MRGVVSSCAIALALAVGGCHAETAAPTKGAATAKVTVTPSPPIAASASSSPSPLPAPSYRPVVFADMAIAGAGFVEGGGLVVLTETELWLLHPESPREAQVVPLPAPLGFDAERGLAVSEDSDLVAVTLHDKSVDVFRVSSAAGGLALEKVQVDKQLAGLPARPVQDRPTTARRRDGRYTVSTSDGLWVTDATDHAVIRWNRGPRSTDRELTWRHDGVEVSHESALFEPLFRVARDGATPAAGWPEPPRPDASCGDDPRWREVSDDAAVYIGQAHDHQIVCRCSAAGCTRTVLDEPKAGPTAEPLLPELALGASPAGAVLSVTTADDAHRNHLVLRRHGSSGATLGKVRRSLPPRCAAVIDAAFVDERLFVLCLGDTARFVVELSPVDLSVKARRLAPPLACGSEVVRTFGHLLYVGCEWASDGALVSPDWVSRPDEPEAGRLYIWADAGALVGHDAKVTLGGNGATADSVVQCFDGHELLPFAACRASVLAR